MVVFEIWSLGNKPFQNLSIREVHIGRDNISTIMCIAYCQVYGSTRFIQVTYYALLVGFTYNTVCCRFVAFPLTHTCSFNVRVYL